MLQAIILPLTATYASKIVLNEPPKPKLFLNASPTDSISLKTPQFRSGIIHQTPLTDNEKAGLASLGVAEEGYFDWLNQLIQPANLGQDELLMLRKKIKHCKLEMHQLLMEPVQRLEQNAIQQRAIQIDPSHSINEAEMQHQLVLLKTQFVFGKWCKEVGFNPEQNQPLATEVFNAFATQNFHILPKIVSKNKESFKPEQCKKNAQKNWTESGKFRSFYNSTLQFEPEHRAEMLKQYLQYLCDVKYSQQLAEAADILQKPIDWNVNPSLHSIREVKDSQEYKALAVKTKELRKALASKRLDCLLANWRPIRNAILEPFKKKNPDLIRQFFQEFDAWLSINSQVEERIRLANKTSNMGNPLKGFTQFLVNQNALLEWTGVPQVLSNQQRLGKLKQFFGETSSQYEKKADELMRKMLEITGRLAQQELAKK